MLLPEEIKSIETDILIIAIIFVCSLEGRMSSVHDEQDDSEREDVSDMALVWLVRQDFRCHIGWRTNLGLAEARSISTTDLACKSEIDNFHVKIGI